MRPRSRARAQNASTSPIPLKVPRQFYSGDVARFGPPNPRSLRSAKPPSARHSPLALPKALVAGRPGFCRDDQRGYGGTQRRHTAFDVIPTSKAPGGPPISIRRFAEAVLAEELAEVFAVDLGVARGGGEVAVVALEERADVLALERVDHQRLG